MTSWKKWVSGHGVTPGGRFSFRSCGEHERRVYDNMTLITPDGDGQPVEELLSSAEQYFRSAEKILREQISLLEAGGALAGNDTKKSVQTYNEALGLFVKERQKIEERRNKTAGITRGYALDFGAARAEIGRRLACLRDAGSTGKLSE